MQRPPAPLIAGALAALLTLACAPQPAPPPDDRRGDRDEDEPKRAPDDKPGLGGLGKFAPLGAMMAARLDEPGPYDPPKRSPGFRADAPHYLALSLKGELTEAASFSLSFGGPAPTIELHPLLQRLERAAADPNVRGLLLQLDGVDTDWAVAAELRAGLLRFKGDGQRRLLCHVDGASNPEYHLLTACDQIGLSPLGTVTVSGAAATPVHLKGLLDRLGVFADFTHVGAFKGAAEPLTRSAPSKEMLTTLDAIVDQAYLTQRRGLIEGRRFDDARAIATIDRGIFHSEAARDAGLVDAIATFVDFRREALEGAEWTQLKSAASDAGAFDMTKLQVFLGLLPAKRPAGPHVALVYALGDIIDGEGQGLLGAREEIAGHTLANALRALADDPSVTAVVLRVNSGGGSALASEQIAAALEAVKRKKPVVASMGRVAASGGYYIASGAAKIYAQPDTLTGSIGVVGGKIVLGKTLKQIGVDTYSVTRGRRAALWSAMSPWTEDERAEIQRMMEDTYKVFLSRVMAGRGKTYEDAHALAQGRVWTGAAAQANGLIDELGGLHDALAHARQLGGVDPATELEIYPPEPTLKDLLRGLGPVSAPHGVHALLAEIEATAGRPTARVIQRALSQILRLRQQRIATVALFPVLIE